MQEEAQTASGRGHGVALVPPCVPANSPCTSSVAVLVVGEFREFKAPERASNARWKRLTAETAWSALQSAVVASKNGPADLIVHTWNGTLATRLLGTSSVQPCASVCEAYGEAYMQRILGNYTGFKLIAGKLRLRDPRETPHIVDFFYKRYAALRLMQHVERQRGRRYRTALMIRPDVVFVSKTPVRLPEMLLPHTVYVHNSDHHHDSTDTDTSADPMSRGQCGQMPNDWFAYGDRASMGQYLGGFPILPALHARMLTVRGHCDWWKCHNYRYNFTFLINAEGYLGMHLRSVGLGCRDVMQMTPPIGLALPPTRKRDWTSPAAHARARHRQ